MSTSTWIMLFIYVFIIGGSSIYTLVRTLKDSANNKD
jgi:hypothetical protein